MFGSSKPAPCQSILKSSATAKRTLMNGLSVSAQSPLQGSGMRSASGPADQQQPVNVLTGHVGEEQEISIHVSTSEQSSNGSSKLTRYWLQERRNAQGWIETTVYRDGFGGLWRGHERPYAEWWRYVKAIPDGLFCTELPDNLTIAEAARQLRMAREDKK